MPSWGLHLPSPMLRARGSLSQRLFALRVGGASATLLGVSALPRCSQHLSFLPMPLASLLRFPNLSRSAVAGAMLQKACHLSGLWLPLETWRPRQLLFFLQLDAQYLLLLRFLTFSRSARRKLCSKKLAARGASAAFFGHPKQHQLAVPRLRPQPRLAAAL